MTLRHYSVCAFLVFAACCLFVQPAKSEEGPSFTKVPELSTGFRLLYIQQFGEARRQFSYWGAQHPEEPFGQVAVAASYLYEEFYYQGVLTSEFFLDEKRFLNGIEGKPNAERMQHFQEAVARARVISKSRLTKNGKDKEALFALTLSAGMESDADMILKKQNIEALKRLKEANLYAKQLLALKPDANDAYVALGSANYIIGSLSAGFRALLWFGGIHGDKKLGMEQLGKTVQGGNYLRPFGKVMLALAARREKQNAVAQRLLHELMEEFPESPLYGAEYSKATGQQPQMRSRP
jgi:hypothetical protein